VKRFIRLHSKLFSAVQMDSKRGLGSIGGSSPPAVSHHRTPQILRLAYEKFLPNLPCWERIMLNPPVL
jgi:hypothetical protein